MKKYLLGLVSAFAVLVFVFSFITNVLNAQTVNTESGGPDLTIGSTGGYVTELQNILILEGYLVLPAGESLGYFGQATQSAVARWQVANGISPANGYFGPISKSVFIANVLNNQTAPIVSPSIVLGNIPTSVVRGDQAKITWSVKTELPGNYVRVQVLDSANNIVITSGSINKNNVSWNWNTNKNLTPGIYKVKVYAHSNNSIVSDIKKIIVIESPIKITYPNGGEKINTGKKIRIKWDGSNPDKYVNIILEFSPIGYSNSEIMQDSISINSVKDLGYYDWTPSEFYLKGIKTGSFSIKIDRIDRSDLSDSSDNTFSIIQGKSVPRLVLTEPILGQSFSQGQIIPIKIKGNEKTNGIGSTLILLKKNDDSFAKWTWVSNDHRGLGWEVPRGLSQGEYYLQLAMANLEKEARGIVGYSNYFTISNQTSAPVNGQCGSASSQAPVTVKPTTNLCASGTATTVSGPGGGWTWNCSGLNGGSTASCSVPFVESNPVVCTSQYAPVCGVDGKTYSNACKAGVVGAAVGYDGECSSTSSTTATLKLSINEKYPSVSVKRNEIVVLNWNYSSKEKGASCSFSGHYARDIQGRLTENTDYYRNLPTSGTIGLYADHPNIPNLTFMEYVINCSDSKGLNSVSDKVSVNIIPSDSPSSSITITSPNGGENLTEGSKVNITWQSDLPKSQDLEVYLQLGKYDIGKFIGKVKNREGKFSWTVKGVDSIISNESNPPAVFKSDGTYRILIVCPHTSPDCMKKNGNGTESNYSDSSDKTFTINTNPANPVITLGDLPASVVRGEQARITWSYQGDLPGSYVRVQILNSDNKEVAKSSSINHKNWDRWNWNTNRSLTPGVYQVKVYSHSDNTIVSNVKYINVVTSETPIEKETVCTTQYAPVCGSDGKTYTNACRAASVGVNYINGACEATSVTPQPRDIIVTPPPVNNQPIINTSSGSTPATPQLIVTPPPVNNQPIIRMPAVVDGKCGTTLNNCVSGQSLPDGINTWQCVGSGTGRTAICTVPTSVTPKPRTINMPISTTIKPGEEGKHVTVLQTALQQIGVYTGPITGYFGDLTKNAVSSFQTANSLEAVGEVGPKTRALLNFLLSR